MFYFAERRQEIYTSVGISERGQLGSQGAVWEKREKGREKGELWVGVEQYSEKRVLVRCLSGIVRCLL